MFKEWSSVFCLTCEYFDWENYGMCKAFPVGIPHVIVSNERDHWKPLEGQLNDLAFKEKIGGKA